ncbi:HNH endonuclease [Pseudomonas denitrificans (nom. rej.)]|uniref:HNH endonuclease n=1 Tax=Pseudomonas denitrificans TaxID=43306 RepID=A0A9X7N614_PSEDE|nr:HNH endonuclease [Pseudomonas denitrificans (nom. rej.)]
MTRSAAPERRGTSASRGYGHRWRLARADHLRRHPCCSMCSTDHRPVAAVVVDHKVAPKLGEAKASGDRDRIANAWRLFWDRDNWQSLCKFCHDSTKQRLERSGRLAGCSTDGRPLDPRHHWNR